eukprot:8648038-Karenia_brevis.AAC.2
MQGWIVHANILEEQNRHFQCYLQSCPDGGAFRYEDSHDTMPRIVNRLDEINCQFDRLSRYVDDSINTWKHKYDKRQGLTR